MHQIRRRRGGFSLIELMIGMLVLSVGILAVASMFPMAYVVVDNAGDLTMSITAARQVLENVRSVPFDSLNDLNGFDTADVNSLPAAGPERELARRWRYALAGPGNGFTYSTTETTTWSKLSTGEKSISMGGRGQIFVVAPSPTLRLVTVRITLPGRSIQFATRVARL